MTDVVGEIKARRSGGWPKGKPRTPKPEAIQAAADRAEETARQPKSAMKMKARPNWESEDFIGAGGEGADRLNIPQEIVNSLYRDGYALQWCTKSVRGQDMPQEMSAMTRGGWTPVHQSDFDGIIDGLFMPKGQDSQVIVEDSILMARPAEIQRKARQHQSREALRPMQITEEQIGRGIPGVTGADHPTARRGNMIKKTFEPIEIPE